MAKHIPFGEPQNDSEVWAFDFLEKHLPDDIEILTNIEVLSESGQPFEVDAIVLAPWAIHIIDVKGYYGNVRAGKDIWELDGRQVENPLPKANLVAKLFKGRMQRRASRDMYLPWCQGGAFLTGVKGQGLSLVKSDSQLCAWGPDQIIDALTTKRFVTSSFQHEVTPEQWRLARDVAGQTDLVLRKQNKIGDFHRTKKIHADRGMEVWLANYQHGEYKRRFLLKVLDPSGYSTANDADHAISNLRTEASLYLELSGLAGIPYVAPLIDTGEMLALPIRLPSGKSLSQVSPGSLGNEQKLKILRSAATALQGIHNRGLSHGNLKPDSIFVSDASEVEYLDIKGNVEAGRTKDRKALANEFMSWFDENTPEVLKWFRSESHDLESLRMAVAITLNPDIVTLTEGQPVLIKPGEVVAGHFRLLEELRVEGEVRIWRARHTLGRFDCVLQIHDQGEERFRRVREGFGLLGQVFHPNICRVFDIGSIDEQRHYVARAWVDGSSLHALICDQKRLHANQMLNCIKQVATAIQYLHSIGTTHRNIKPVSVVLDGENSVLIDLGMTDPDDNRSGSIVFRDPRVGKEGWTNEADLYALSLTIMCVGLGIAEPPLRTTTEWDDFVTAALVKLPFELQGGVTIAMNLFPDGLPSDYLDFFGLKEDEEPLTELPDEFRERFGISKGYMEFLVVDMINDGRTRSRNQWVLHALRSRKIPGNQLNRSSMNATVSRLFSASVAEKRGKRSLRLTAKFKKEWDTYKTKENNL